MNNLQLRIDSDIAHMLDTMSFGRRTTKSALVRDLIIREWREHEREATTDRLRSSRADRVAALSDRAARKSRARVESEAENMLKFEAIQEHARYAKARALEMDAERAALDAQRVASDRADMAERTGAWSMVSRGNVWQRSTEARARHWIGVLDAGRAWEIRCSGTVMDSGVSTGRVDGVGPANEPAPEPVTAERATG